MLKTNISLSSFDFSKRSADPGAVFSASENVAGGHFLNKNIFEIISEKGQLLPAVRNHPSGTPHFYYEQNGFKVGPLEL